MFEFIKNTPIGKALKEWSEIFQPTYNDISKWKDVQDIGRFSDDTIEEIKEAWATLPSSTKKDLYKAYLLLKQYLSADVIKELLKKYIVFSGINL